jgi:hypothetical protein
LELFLSPEEILFDALDPGIQGEVVRRLFLGASTEYTLKLPSGRLPAACSHAIEHR